MTTLGEMTLEDAATQAAGNWRRFGSFIWFRDDDIPEPDSWAIIYTHNRDSRLLDLSNAQIIAKTMRSFAESEDPDVVFESHDHWAVGHVDGFSIRVFRDGEITDAFKTYHALAERLADYPILDETDYGRREYEATLENIADAAWRLKDEHDLPEGWECEVGGDVEDHDICLVPGIGTYFARCRRANEGDPTEDAPRTMTSETRAALERADTSDDCRRPDHQGE